MKKTITNFKMLLLTAILLLGSINVWGQSYTQITTLAELQTGNYLIVGDGSTNDGIMKNTVASGPYIEYTSVTNPGSTITTGFGSQNIFLITVTGSQITIYNSTPGYASYSGSGNAATFNNTATPGNSEKWTFSVSGGLWTITNVGTSGRMLQWNNSTPRFACYTSNQIKLKLYKEVATTPALTITSPAANATINSQDVEIEFTVDNFTIGASDGKIKYTVDGGAASYTTASSINLTGLSYNTHTVVLELVNDDQSSLTPAATASVTFTCDEASTLCWNFTDGTGNAANIVTNLTSNAMTIGNPLGAVATPINSSSTSSGYTGSSGGNNIGNAVNIGAINVSSSAYIEFQLTPSIDYIFQLTNISFGVRATSTGAQSWSLRSSKDSYATDIATGAINANATWELKNENISFENSENTTFRIFLYGGSGIPANNTINTRLDDIALSVIVKPNTSDPLAAPINLVTSNVLDTSFTLSWDAVVGATGYEVDVYTKASAGWTVNTEEFQIAPPYVTLPEWTTNSTSINQTNGYYWDSPSLKLDSPGVYLQTNLVSEPLESLGYYARAQVAGSVLKIEGRATLEDGWSTIVTPTIPTGYVSGTVAWILGDLGFDNVRQLKLSNISGDISIDDVTIVYPSGENLTYVSGYEAKPTTNTSMLINGLLKTTQYYFVVRAIAGAETSENSVEGNVTTLDKVETPQITPPSGSYSPFTCTITCATEDAVIYYTLDNSEPTTSSNLYSGGIAINSSCTVTAKAFKAGFASSDTVKAIYVVKHTITATAGSNGSISPSGTVAVSHGTSQAFTITPNTGYEIDEVLIDGVNNPTAVSSGTYSFTTVTANHTIAVTFKLKQYTITATAGANGSISPSGVITVPHGTNASFTITPNTNYVIDQVLVDGINNAAAVSSGTYSFATVTANHTISATFKLKEYTITATAGANGSITPSGAVSVTHGTSQTFTITPNTNYVIDQVLVDGINNAAAVSSGTYEFTNVTDNYTIHATFKLIEYTISASAGANGSITPNGAVSVTHGTNQTFTITPNANYVIDQILVDGVNNPAAVSSGTSEFTNVSANHTIHATFKLKEYTITATVGANGNISPSGAVVVNHGASQTFTITPNTNYEIATVLINGVNNPTAVSSGTYEFTNVTANHIIHATFKLKQYTITASAGANGNISPSGAVVVNHGTSQTFIITPNTNYEIATVLIDGANNPAAVSSGSYEFVNVTDNHTIAATFKLKEYTITASAGANGSITPNGAVTVTHGTSQMFTITPNTNYEIDQVLVDGVNNPTAVSSGTYEFTNVTDNYTIHATFKLKQYTITATVGVNGNISPNGAVSVTHGTSQTFTITPNTNYEIDQVLIDGVNNPAAVSSGSYQFANVTANHTIHATFTSTATNDAGLDDIVSDIPFTSEFDKTVYNYTVIAPCGTNNATIVPAASSGSSITMTLNGSPATMPIAINTGDARKTLVIRSANGTDTKEYSILIVAPYDYNKVVALIWDNVLSVINEPNHNGGYSFIAQQWMENGVLLNEIGGNLYLSNRPNSQTAIYNVQLTTGDGITTTTCNQSLVRANTSPMRVFPNPVKMGTMINVHTFLSDKELNGAKIRLYNMQGVLVQEVSAEYKATIVAPNMQGTYVLQVTTKDGIKKTFNIVVQ